MIYIVEDDDAIRELEQYALQSNGYEVASFASSEPFWQAMRTEAPELVILDVMLPGIDGFNLKMNVSILSLMRQCTDYALRYSHNSDRWFGPVLAKHFFE